MDTSPIVVPPSPSVLPWWPTCIGYGVPQRTIVPLSASERQSGWSGRAQGNLSSWVGCRGKLMTVVSAAITQHCTAHASDSFLTSLEPNGSRKTVEPEKPKLVSVKHFRGILAFWGLARCGRWSTLDWLRRQAECARHFSSAEKFADSTASGLNQELTKLPITSYAGKGIGIHFTAYERFNDYWIPELFLISNWAGIPYTNLRPTGIGVTRETYHTIKNVPPSAGTSRVAVSSRSAPSSPGRGDVQV
jgi:hypothetical protein